MTFSIALLLGLLLAAVVLFALEWLSVDIVTLLLLVALVLTGTLTAAEAFSGFANEIIIVLGSIFIISGVFVQTGVMEWLGRAIHRLGGKSESKAVAAIMALSASVSALISNTSSTAILMPATFELGKKSGISPSRLLIPLAFASMLGGTCTLIGTSTNLAASGMMSKLGLEPIGFLEFTPIGLIIVVVGIAYMALIGRRLLPQTIHPSLTQEYHVREYLSEITIGEGSPLDRKTIAVTGLSEQGINILDIVRGERKLYPYAHTELRAGDLLIVLASKESLLAVTDRNDLKLRSDGELDDRDLQTAEITLLEAIVMARSRLAGGTLRKLDLRRRMGLSVLAVYRQGQNYPIGIGDFVLREGDVLLIEAQKERIEALQGNQDLWVLGEVAHIPFRKRKGTIAMVALGAAIVVGSLGLVPISVALLMAALAMVLLRCVDVNEVYGFIDWRVIVLIGGMTSFGLAMEKTHASDYIAGLVVQWGLPLGLYFVMATFALLTMLLTQPMSNAAAALVMLPIAVSTATQLGVNPRTFAVLVTLSASLSFIAPFEPACLLVFGPGRYRFADFVKSGVALSLVVFILLILLVPVLWPL